MKRQLPIMLLICAGTVAVLLRAHSRHGEAPRRGIETPSSQPFQEPRWAIEARNGIVASVSAPGSEAGISILKAGGNAVDAAVATAFALAVAYPPAGNLAGGGFMLVHPAPGEGDPVAIDYRETAPAAA